MIYPKRLKDAAYPKVWAIMRDAEQLRMGPYSLDEIDRALEIARADETPLPELPDNDLEPVIAWWGIEPTKNLAKI